VTEHSAAEPAPSCHATHGCVKPSERVCAPPRMVGPDLTLQLYSARAVDRGLAPQRTDARHNVTTIDNTDQSRVAACGAL